MTSLEELHFANEFRRLAMLEATGEATEDQIKQLDEMSKARGPGDARLKVHPAGIFAPLIEELNRRIRRPASKIKRKHREYKFQDQRIHEAKQAALIEVLEFVVALQQTHHRNGKR